MTNTSSKSVHQLSNYHKLFVDEFVSHMERKLKENFEERKMKEKEELRYRDKEKEFDEYWKDMLIL